ncbi:helix-turn-helix domain-containing protein [Haloglycomyces albus]|uniref:helix-turn-helix domain-containing protein n=1 Tax=Haloglycomyces albus TaxID=526067 RepID=UPI00046D76DC|nr:helix-turn-helix transcriptional regulator [Haloglycomyces albus]
MNDTAPSSTRDMNARIGTIIRQSRLQANLTLHQAGRRCGFSSSTLSRLERGLLPWTVADLRHIAQALNIPMQKVGLAALPDQTQMMTNHASVRHDETMKRRTILSTGLATGTAIALPATPLDSVLYHAPNVTAPGLSQLNNHVVEAEKRLANAQIPTLHRSLSQLIPAAQAAYGNVRTEQSADAAQLLARTYIVAAQVLYRSSKDTHAAVAADRAVRYASDGHDPVIAAEAGRVVGVVLRRHSDPGATDVVLRSADELADHTGLTSARAASMYAHLLCTSAYTAAKNNKSEDAWMLFGEAVSAHQPHAILTTEELAVYRMSIARALGDYAATLEYAHAVVPGEITTTHQQGRFWQDVAMSAYNTGDISMTLHALEQVHSTVPQQLIHRPWAHQLVENALQTYKGGASPLLRDIEARQNMIRSV